jgi:hypothetical protein
MPITLSLGDILQLVSGDDFTAQRRYLYDHTSAFGWSYVIPEHIAAQIKLEDPNELVAVVRAYDSPIGTFYVLFSTFEFVESGERKRLNKVAYEQSEFAVKHSAQKRSFEIIEYFVKACGTTHAGLAKVFRPILILAVTGHGYPTEKIVDMIRQLDGGTGAMGQFLPPEYRDGATQQTTTQNNDTPTQDAPIDH